jgi:hypothetical protein
MKLINVAEKLINWLIEKFWLFFIYCKRQEKVFSKVYDSTFLRQLDLQPKLFSVSEFIWMFFLQHSWPFLILSLFFIDFSCQQHGVIAQDTVKNRRP